ncbi:MAG: hypothetical protein NWF13_07285 [Candidatus Bathyarchaeota archaeon]|nr:hypothetical protein [Candidatus Bathyarchaeota archaeon]
MSKTAFSLIIIITLVLLVSTISVIDSSFTNPKVSDSHPSSTQLNNTSSYLLKMYNPTVGLVANSEDKGPNPSPDPVPCYNTYWVYSDNLYAGYALQPFNQKIADNITDTVQRYIDDWGWPLLFEVAIGVPIPTVIHDGKDIVVNDGVVNGTRVQVLLDRHQPHDNAGTFQDADTYADLCFYMSLNFWLKGDRVMSENWFRKGEALWNHNTNYGFYDQAVYNPNSITYRRYQNYKDGLFLFTQRVTEFDSTITEFVEAAAWSYQNNKTGGITTQRWLNGSRFGTANTETTAALLLAYNEHLISKLHDSFGIANTWPYWTTMILIFTVVAVTIIIVLNIGNIRHRIAARIARVS